VTTADQLRQRAREVDDHAWAIRWQSPMESRALHSIARELTELADHLPPERAPL